MLSVLQIIASVDPEAGGPVEGVVQHLRAAADEVVGEIATLDDAKAPFVTRFPAPVHALGFGTPSGWRRWLPGKRYGYSPALVPWLRDHLKNYDVVIVNGLWNYSTLAARRALVGADVPYIVFVHGMLDPWFAKTYPLKTMLKRLFWLFSEGPLLNNADAVLFTTEEERLLAAKTFRPYHVKGTVVGYFCADFVGDAAACEAAFRQAVPTLGARPYLLFLSRIHPKKGCDLLVEAFARKAHLQPNLDLVIAGPDSEGLRLKLQELAKEKGIENRIHWPGMIVGDVKWGALLGAEAFILPSHQENFGVAVVEAMAVGTPVLITNKINIWREIQQSGGGFVEDDTVTGITTLLERFHDLSSAEREQMGNRARAGFETYFDSRVTAEKVTHVLKEAIAKRQRKKGATLADADTPSQPTRPGNGAR